MNFELGRYTITLRATYGDNPTTLAASRTVWVVRWRKQGWKFLIGLAVLVLIFLARRRFWAFFHVLGTEDETLGK